jgi:hypothetical protein
VSATDKHTDKKGAYLALRGELAAIIGHLNDISVALHSISYELEQIRHALAKDSSAPISMPHGEMTRAE